MTGGNDPCMADPDCVTRAEFDAVRAMAAKAREENDARAARIAALDASAKGRAPAAHPSFPNGSQVSGVIPKKPLYRIPRDAHYIS
jgi:hypothetical protein